MAQARPRPPVSVCGPAWPLHGSGRFGWAEVGSSPSFLLRRAPISVATTRPAVRGGRREEHGDASRDGLGQVSLRPRAVRHRARRWSTEARWSAACCASTACSTCSPSTAATRSRSWRALRDNGVKLIHMRHEQACAYAADALRAHDGQRRGVQRHRRLRPDQRRHRPLPGRADRQRRGLHRRPASRPPRTASARSRKRTASEICRSFSKFDASACSTGR